MFPALWGFVNDFADECYMQATNIQPAVCVRAKRWSGVELRPTKYLMGSEFASPALDLNQRNVDGDFN